MDNIKSFFRKIGYVIKRAPLLTAIGVMSITLTCITIIEVGPENLPNNWLSTPVFALMIEQDYPDIAVASEDFTDEIDGDTDYYDPDIDEPEDIYDTDVPDSNVTDTDTAEDKTDISDDNPKPTDNTETGSTEKEPDGSKETEDPGSSENTESTEDDGLVRDGVTVYETYKPRKSKHECYVDTGLIPLTTEYDYFKAEDYSYFDDAIFIGDSRTVGLQYYSELPEHADFVCQTGLSINKALSTDCAKDRKTGRTVNGEKLLKKYTYKKVYLSIGINDIGTGNTEYIAKIYKNLLDKIRSYQPDAIIYIQSIMPVTKAKSKSDNIINNENINAKNAAIAKFADGEQVFYININEFFTDQSYTAHSGALLAEQSTDGVHIQAVYYRQWAELLLNYGIKTTDE